MTTFYIDPVNGNNANDGLGTGAGNAWLDLDKFTENARSAGDKVIIRRGANQCDDGTDLLFTSDGTIANPIIIEADFDNAWGDQVDLSATATATLTFGSKTVNFSASVAGVLAAGDWIYANGDNNREFAYEVASVVTTTVTLYLPYKGNQAGSGKTMYNMQDNPIWNTAAGNIVWQLVTDDFWKIQGITIRGTSALGNVVIYSARCHQFNDCVFIGAGGDDIGIYMNNDFAIYVVKKCRFYNHRFNISYNTADVFGDVFMANSLLDGNNITDSYGIYNPTSAQAKFNFIIQESEILNHTAADLVTIGGYGFFKLRNTKLSSTTEIASITSAASGLFMSEDHDGVLNDTRFHYPAGPGSNLNQAMLQSETTTVRSGGSNKSIKVTPTANLTTIWDFNKLLIFELPIYATTDSKTYTVYFNLPDANFSVDPTASELWLELEAWGHATNNFRKITKSTGTVISDDNWNSLTVTVAPDQAGVAYLRCWYAKTKEAGSNIFFVDPIPEIT